MKLKRRTRDFAFFLRSTHRKRCTARYGRYVERLGGRLFKVCPRPRRSAILFCLKQKHREKHKHQVRRLLACYTRHSSRCPAGRVFVWPSQRRTCGLGEPERASCWGTETRSSEIRPSRLKLSREAQYFRYRRMMLQDLRPVFAIPGYRGVRAAGICSRRMLVDTIYSVTQARGSS